MNRTITLLTTALLMAACTANSEPPSVEPATEPAPGVAAACLPDAPDCQDTVVGADDEPAAEPQRGVAVADAVDQSIDGPFELAGIFFADETGARLCSALAESFPPQCGGPSIELLGDLTVDFAVQTEGGVTWSDDIVYIEGTLGDGGFTPAG